MKLKDHFRDFIISNKITYGFLAKTFWAILLCRLIYFIFHSVHFIYLVKYNCHLKLKSKSIYVYIFLSLAKIISFGSFRVQMCVTIGDSEGTRIDLSELWRVEEDRLGKPFPEEGGTNKCIWRHRSVSVKAQHPLARDFEYPTSLSII